MSPTPFLIGIGSALIGCHFHSIVLGLGLCFLILPAFFALEGFQSLFIRICIALERIARK